MSAQTCRPPSETSLLTGLRFHKSCRALLQLLLHSCYRNPDCKTLCCTWKAFHIFAISWHLQSLLLFFHLHTNNSNDCRHHLRGRTDSHGHSTPWHPKLSPPTFGLKAQPTAPKSMALPLLDTMGSHSHTWYASPDSLPLRVALLGTRTAFHSAHPRSCSIELRKTRSRDTVERRP